MSLIQGGPGALEVRGRRKASTAEDASKLEEDLAGKLAKYAEEGKAVVIQDFDLSQNHCPIDNFASFFTVLTDASVHVLRFRLFGCPTLTDEACYHLAEYLKTVSAETAPTEIHLSDCAITTEGFDFLMSAIEESDAFPCVNPFTKKQTPLYLRLENNYIEPSVIQAKIDSEVIRTIAKDWKTSVGTYSGETKVNLVQKSGDDTFQQKEGIPPAAEDVAPVTKPVFDQKRTDLKGKGKGKGKDVPMAMLHRHITYLNGRGGFNDQIKIDEVQKAAQGLDSRTVMNWFKDIEEKKDEIKDPTAYITTALRKLGGGKLQQQSQWPGFGNAGSQFMVPLGRDELAKIHRHITYLNGRGGFNGAIKVDEVQKAAQGLDPRTIMKCFKDAEEKKEEIKDANAYITSALRKVGGGKAQQQPQWQGSWSQGHAQPAGQGKSNGQAADRSRTPAKRHPHPPLPPGRKPTLPYPWEEHWSDEYKIAYYWNSVTEESSWEMPVQ